LITERGARAHPDGKAIDLIEKLNTAVRDTVRYGWRMFYPFTRPEIAPRIVIDPAVDGGN
jgi:hypothetical protein